MGTQEKLVEALAALDSDRYELSKMYLGAVYTLNDDQNPHRFAQAAHSMRELLEKLSVVVPEVPTDRGEPMRSRVDRLSEEWRQLVDGPGLSSIRDGQSAIDQFRPSLEEFFAWVADHVQPYRERARATLRGMDNSPTELPPDLLEERVRAWMKLKDYFTSVAHGKATTDPEFEIALQRTEGLLADALAPSPAEDLDELDRLIAQGEEE